MKPTAIDTGISRVRVRKMPTDIAERRRPEQCVADCVNQHIPVRMGFKSSIMGNAHTADHDVITFAKAVRIVTVTNSHDIAL